MNEPHIRVEFFDEQIYDDPSFTKHRYSSIFISRKVNFNGKTNLLGGHMYINHVEGVS